MVLFADRPVFAFDLSENREYAKNALADYRANGGTSLYDAVSDSLIRLKRADGRRVVVVMTDGRDENNPGTAPGSVRKPEDVAKLIHDTGALVFSIGLGTNVDRGSLQQFADLSGGRAFFPTEIARAGGGVPPGRGRPAPTLRRRLHVVAHSARRDVAQRRDQAQIAPGRQDQDARRYFAPAK